MVRNDEGHARVRTVLGSKLLAVGGTHIAWREHRLCEIAHGGQFFHERPRLRRGPWSSSHSNSAAVWGQNVFRNRLATGYALSQNGLWEAHSWVMDRGRLLETTTPRLRYYGVLLGHEEALSFWRGHFLRKHYGTPLEMMSAARREAPARDKDAAHDPCRAAPAPTWDAVFEDASRQYC